MSKVTYFVLIESAGPAWVVARSAEHPEWLRAVGKFYDPARASAYAAAETGRQGRLAFGEQPQDDPTANPPAWELPPSLLGMIVEAVRAQQHAWDSPPDKGEVNPEPTSFIAELMAGSEAVTAEILRHHPVPHTSAELSEPEPTRESVIVAVDKALETAAETQAVLDRIHEMEPILPPLLGGRLKEMFPPMDAVPQASAELDDAAQQELQEIADGAYGDNPQVRGLARDELARATPEPEGGDAPSETAESSANDSPTYEAALVAEAGAELAAGMRARFSDYGRQCLRPRNPDREGEVVRIHRDGLVSVRWDGNMGKQGTSYSRAFIEAVPPQAPGNGATPFTIEEVLPGDPDHAIAEEALAEYEQEGGHTLAEVKADLEHDEQEPLVSTMARIAERVGLADDLREILAVEAEEAEAQPEAAVEPVDNSPPADKKVPELTADAIEAAFPTLMEAYPRGPRPDEIAVHLKTPTFRVRLALPILEAAGKITMHRRAGKRHMIPNGFKVAPDAPPAMSSPAQVLEALRLQAKDGMAVIEVPGLAADLKMPRSDVLAALYKLEDDSAILHRGYNAGVHTYELAV